MKAKHEFEFQNSSEVEGGTGGFRLRVMRSQKGNQKYCGTTVGMAHCD